MAKPKILLLDPDEKNRSILEVSLKKSGFTVTSGLSGTDGLAAVDTFVPDLIITETNLEDKDGFWMVNQLSNGGELPCPVIFLTKDSDVEAKIRGLDLGADDYLVKPIYLREVVARVRRLLERRHGGAAPAATQSTAPSENQFQGDLNEMGVVDLLQTMDIGGKTAIIHVHDDTRNAQIFVENGSAVHAVAGSLVGERAIYKVMQWTNGHFRIDFKKSIQAQHTINVSLQGIIMEGVRRMDELERLKEQLPQFNARLVIDSEVILEEHPDRFPAKIENILAEFDGVQDIEKVVESLPYDELESLEVISKLYFQGFLVEAPPLPDPKPEPEQKPESNVGESSRFTATGTIDLDSMDLGTVSSVESIKSKARKDDSQSSSKRSSSRKPPVFDSLPGFDLAPPSERVVQVSQRKKVAQNSRSDSQSNSNNSSGSSQRNSKSGSGRMVQHYDSSFKAASATDLAPPVVPGKKKPKAPSTDSGPDHTMAAPNDRVSESDQAPNKLKVGKIAIEKKAVPATASAASVSVQESAPPQPKTVKKQAAARKTTEGSKAAASASGKGAAAGTPHHGSQAGEESKSTDRVRMAVIVSLFGLLIAIGAAIAFLLVDTSKRSAPEYYQLAIEAYGAKQFNQALEHAHNALELSPSMTKARVLSADINVELGEIQTAINQYNSVIAVDPSLFDVRLRYSRLLFDQRQKTSAERALAELRSMLIDLSPLRDRRLYADAVVLQTDVLIFLQMLDDARLSLKSLKESDPGNSEISRLESALSRLEQLKNIENQRKAEQIKASEPVAPKTSAMEVKPKPTPKPQKPKPKPVQKNVPKKPSAAEVARQKQAKANALHSKGLEYYRKGYLKNSERSFLAALEQDADNIDVLIDLGRVYSELGQDRVALKYFLRAASINPNNPRAYINLGSIYLLMGNRDDAIKAYRTFVKLSPEGSADVREVRKILQNLGAQ